MKNPRSCYSLVLAALAAVISLSACYPLGGMQGYFPAENVQWQRIWEVMEQQEKEPYYEEFYPNYPSVNLQQDNTPVRSCITDLYVLAFTGGSEQAEGDDLPFIEIDVDGNVGITVRFPDMEKIDEMTKNKGDVWTIDFSEFQLGDCVKESHIRSVTLKPGGNDSWLVESIVTMVLAADGHYQLLTVDMNINHKIDEDGQRSETHQLQLTKVE